MFEYLFRDLVNAAWGAANGEYHDPQRIISYSGESLKDLNDEQLGEAATQLVRHFHADADWNKGVRNMDQYISNSEEFGSYINLMIRYKEAFEFIEKAANYLARYNEWKCYF